MEFVYNLFTYSIVILDIFWCTMRQAAFSEVTIVVFPQDKVAEFAKMSQQQLLEATEKAVSAN